MRSYCSEPNRGRRCWEGKKEEQAAAYANRRRIGRTREAVVAAAGRKVERSFAHRYETGGMRRVHLRHHPNILKRLLVHVAAFNLGLVMRKLLGRGTPRGLQGYDAALFLTLLRLLRGVRASPVAWKETPPLFNPFQRLTRSMSLPETHCSPRRKRPFPPRAARAKSIRPWKRTRSLVSALLVVSISKKNRGTSLRDPQTATGGSLHQPAVLVQELV